MTKILHGAIAMAILFISSICGSACIGDCDPERHDIESGQYVLDGGFGVLNWLADGQMTIDREAETATLRYTREGTTYDVEFKLTHR